MVDLVIPRPGESINEVVVSKWFVPNGSWVDRDQEVGEIESDKATLPLIAPVSGKIELLIEAGQSAIVGDVACRIDELAKNDNVNNETLPVPEALPDKSGQLNSLNTDEIEEAKNTTVYVEDKANQVKMSPLARKLMNDNNLNVDDIINGLRRLNKDDVEAVIANTTLEPSPSATGQPLRTEGREPMSQLRKKLSARLVAVRNQTAMLTTFNEIDMSALMVLRAKYQKSFTEKYGLKLGFMSFFTKAASIALLKFPRINSQLDGDIIVSPKYVDMAIAVQTDKGLMVPVVRNTDSISIPEIEKSIAALALKARAARLSIDEMTGGTFTITNGGVFGSLLSTPIINPPQSAILGMHNITERPVAINGKVEVRPVMFVALSYDHRIIDGRDSVSFLVKVKELIEKPESLLFNGKDVGEVLLGL